MNWTDEQLIIIMDAAFGLDTHRMSANFIRNFVQLTSEEILNRMEKLFPSTDFSIDADWDDVRPVWLESDYYKPSNPEYILKRLL